MDNQRLKSSVATLSVASNTLLVAVKLIVGFMIGSVSVISEAIHSGVDLIAAIIALIAVKTGGKPADQKHPFGHGKIENVSGTIEAVLIFVAAGWIIYEAVDKLMHPREVDRIGWGVAVMFGSSVINLIVSELLFRVGRRTDSIALQADAWHLRTDVYTSAGVMFGLCFIWVGERVFKGADLHWVDPMAAIAVALLIIHAAYKLTAESAGDLLDRALPTEEVERIRKVLAEFVPTVRGFHRLRTRKAGPNRFIEFHIFVDGRMPVAESHALSHRIGGRLRQALGDATVIVHVEPCTGACRPDCSDSCLLGPEQREAIRASREPSGPSAEPSRGT
ncbi:MAG TPA: cation diffusion facilitator family transporter [Planctomycetota bacterium]|nr:cation diffusion facilitator family transporter [Planctomycetota bacterium]